MGDGIPGYFGRTRNRTARDARARWDQSTVPAPDVSDELWQAFAERFEDAYEIARECAKYQYYWDKRTIWLAEHRDLIGTEHYDERREIRRAMTPRWSDLRVAFAEHAAVVQEQAKYLGHDHFERIRADYGLDLTHLGTTIDVFLWQWRGLMIWNPEPVPY